MHVDQHETNRNNIIVRTRITKTYGIIALDSDSQTAQREKLENTETNRYENGRYAIITTAKTKMVGNYAFTDRIR